VRGACGIWWRGCGGGKEGGGAACGGCGAGRRGGVDGFWRSFLRGSWGWGSQGGDGGGGEGAGDGGRYLRWGEAEGEAEGDGLEVGWALRRW